MIELAGRGIRSVSIHGGAVPEPPSWLSSHGGFFDFHCGANEGMFALAERASLVGVAAESTDGTTTLHGCGAPRPPFRGGIKHAYFK